MKFDDFKASKTPTSEEVCDPCVLFRGDSGDDFSDDDTIALMRLRWGFCPRCDHKVSAVVDAKDVNITHYTCDKHTLHYYEVDYNTKIITML